MLYGYQCLITCHCCSSKYLCFFRKSVKSSPIDVVWLIRLLLCMINVWLTGFHINSVQLESFSKNMLSNSRTKMFLVNPPLPWESTMAENYDPKPKLLKGLLWHWYFWCKLLKIQGDNWKQISMKPRQPLFRKLI